MITTREEQAEFIARAEPYRRELHVHCYRMLGSFDEAEDQVQETFLRAWRARDSFQGRSTFRAWMYRIATNTCLDALARRPLPQSAADIPWLQPYPDAQLPSEDEPDAVVVARETIELAFLAAVQLVPPRQRAVLILRDVLDWPAKDAAELLETSVASVNSALQRARATLRENLPEGRHEWPADRSPHEDALVRRYVEASERADVAALAAMLAEDARFSMPPEPGLYVGRDVIHAAWVEGGFGSEAFRDFRCLVTAANRQPAVATYVREPGTDTYRPLAIDLLRIEGGQIAEIVAFPISPAFGLPPAL
jgi:RNA polymerase sigma-70 factor (ECF subfamily)